MKYIELKKLGVSAAMLKEELESGKITADDAERLVREQGAEMDYARVIETVVKSVPVGGLDLAQMRRHLRILDQLEAAGGVLALEDNDHKLLQRLVQEHKWGGVDRNVPTFCDDVAGAASEPPETLAVAAE